MRDNLKSSIREKSNIAVAIAIIGSIKNNYSSSNREKSNIVIAILRKCEHHI